MAIYGRTGDVVANWGNPQKEQRTELLGLVKLEPGGLMRSAEIHVVGYGGRSFMYELTLPRGRYVKRVGIATMAEAREEAEAVARKLLEVFAEPVE